MPADPDDRHRPLKAVPRQELLDIEAWVRGAADAPKRRHGAFGSEAYQRVAAHGAKITQSPHTGSLVCREAASGIA